uniref:Protein kinase domain-containing protein n=1 Tax=Pyramimonas obovata TaxID=1411642 RepID=A0A6T7UYB7_9CHLO|mmetsp:Transcript_12932/g.27295  ORF Transcript_12932/g.27295 Transcript_12932/m.27295 type:complete len:428 (+) Transcript_12932:218-1501(+)|eukprot:CAMPEP_0118923162 /NCGR_PEP_ID=MMETSP1169-20130426/1783_1 /TAXON_ID=36882 /ORGANISM="Pyramimonas obovata, Strain CCMP722" /LENGTH=427 /DNA_ID=CAMNT_0006864109 /DNA_START=216 /DNA_END=1499 /DNA_ORIENTATION=+
MAAAVSHSVGSWSAASSHQKSSRKRAACPSSYPVTRAQLRGNVPRARLRVSSTAGSYKAGGAFAAQLEDTPCEVPKPAKGFGKYDAFSVNDAATPAQLTNVFDHSRELDSKYELGQVLGKGSFGVVRLGRSRTTKQLCAIKSLPKLPPMASRQADGEASLSMYLTKLVDEVDTMVTLSSSPESVHYFGSYEDDTHLHIVMEVCRGGTVQDRLKRDGALSEQETAAVMYSCLKFLEKSHDHGVVYRDIKPENFMFVQNRNQGGSLWQRNQVKVVDFGQCTHLTSTCQELQKRSGTPAYMAPEVIKQCYDAKADIWCAGVMMYQLLSNRLPFWVNVHDHSLKEVWRAILVAEPDMSDDLWSSVSDEGRDMILNMLEKNPRKRQSATQLLRHPWFRAQFSEDRTQAFEQQPNPVRRRLQNCPPAQVPAVA